MLAVLFVLMLLLPCGFALLGGLGKDDAPTASEQTGDDALPRAASTEAAIGAAVAVSEATPDIAPVGLPLADHLNAAPLNAVPVNALPSDATPSAGQAVAMAAAPEPSSASAPLPESLSAAQSALDAARDAVVAALEQVRLMEARVAGLQAQAAAERALAARDAARKAEHAALMESRAEIVAAERRRERQAQKSLQTQKNNPEQPISHASEPAAISPGVLPADHPSLDFPRSRVSRRAA